MRASRLDHLVLTVASIDATVDFYTRRRPKRKYESGAPPAELTSITTTAHSHFGPRIWLAGRRLMSISAAALSPASAVAAAMISLRLRGLKSLHWRLAAMASSTNIGRDPPLT
jgi:hypothetical protein